MKKSNISLKWLIYAFIIGLSGSASFAMLTSSVIPLSPFAALSLFFAINHFYGLYIKEDNEQSIRPAWASLMIGIFSYSAYTSAQYPELGSNLISVLLTLMLSIWLMYQLMFGDKHYSV